MIAPFYLALDPGNKESGYLFFRPDSKRPGAIELGEFGVCNNIALRQKIHSIAMNQRGTLVAEMLRARGMPTANEELETCVQLGRFLQLWGPNWTYVFRHDIKIHHCGTAKATDANVRQALIDLFGGHNKAVGGLKCPRCHGKAWTGREHKPCEECRRTPGWKFPPGPLEGVAHDTWSALAIATFWAAHQQIEHQVLSKKQKEKLK